MSYTNIEDLGKLNETNTEVFKQITSFTIKFDVIDQQGKKSEQQVSEQTITVFMINENTDINILEAYTNKYIRYISNQVVEDIEFLNTLSGQWSQDGSKGYYDYLVSILNKRDNKENETYVENIETINGIEVIIKEYE